MDKTVGLVGVSATSKSLITVVSDDMHILYANHPFIEMKIGKSNIGYLTCKGQPVTFFRGGDPATLQMRVLMYMADIPPFTVGPMTLVSLREIKQALNAAP